MMEPDWITYVPRGVHEAAARLEAACARCEHPSPIGVAETRMADRPTLPARVLWHQVWRYMMECQRRSKNQPRGGVKVCHLRRSGAEVWDRLRGPAAALSR